MSYELLIDAAQQIPEIDIDNVCASNHTQVKKILEQCRPALDQARRAIATRPKVPTEFTYQYFDLHRADLQSQRQLAVAMKLECQLIAREGDLETAMLSLVDLVSLAHCQRRNGLIVDILVACATWSMAISVMASWRKPMPSELRRKVMRLLIESEADCEPITSILARDALWESIVEFPPYDEEEFRKELSAKFSEAEVESVLEMQRIFDSSSTSDSSDKSHCFEASDRSLAYQRLLVIELAVSEYQNDHGEAPESLQALVPKYLLTRLPDPFTNADFVYRVENGSYSLYSVGSKRSDLGGIRGQWHEAALGQADMFLDEPT